MPGSETPEMAECTNSVGGYTVEYPADWRTNPGDVLPSCSLFDPAPIAVEEGTEIPFDIAVSIGVDSVSFDVATGDSPGERVLERERLTVAGCPTVRLEIETTADAPLGPPGMRSTRYLVDLNSATLIASTHDVGALPYGTKQQVLDRMMNTLELVPSP